MTREVRVRTPGKVNLQLGVGPVRDDGYHPLATIFQAVELYEVVSARPRTDDRITLEVELASGLVVAPGSIPLGETNLAWRAARAVALAYGITDGIDLHLYKSVPVAGGMAGGSADAAAALVACAEAWEVGATRAELDDIAATLGADVPFALHGHTAVGLGRGDALSPAMTRGEFHWVFATQATGLSTPAVFDQFDRMTSDAHRPEPSAAVMAALASGNPRALGAAISNDLEAAALALAPQLADTLSAAREADALGAIVSGSGPTIAALGRSRAHSLAIAAHLRASGTCAAAFTASGPAAGATVLPT